MIKLKLDILAKKLGKSIVDIAKDTKINRNSISAIVNGKIDGIKFDTIEKICDTYNVRLDDLIEYTSSKESGSKNYYRQESEGVLFTLFPPAYAISTYKHSLPNKSDSLKTVDLYIKDNYAMAYWDSGAMAHIANEMFLYYSNHQDKMSSLYAKYELTAKTIENSYLNSELIAETNNEELKVFSKNLWKNCLDFWHNSIFIDCFDTGHDHEIISSLAKKSRLSPKEVDTLLTPVQMTFSNERVFALLQLSKLYLQNIKHYKSIAIFVQKHKKAAEYIKKFDFYQTNYGRVKHIQTSEIIDGISRYVKDVKYLDAEITKFGNFENDREQAINAVLKSHRLKNNPLWFFNKLISWREHRKMTNLMSIHLMDRVLTAIEAPTGIPKKYLNFLTHDEIDNVLDGLIEAEVLKKRAETSLLISFKDGNYKMILGEEAESIKNEIDKNLSSWTQNNIIPGHAASQGYVKGFARVIMDDNDFNEFKEGEILVAGATRPEFFPLIQKAGGVVTNEGGITCHAAVISRELGKPCIIGTKNATALIKTGDLVEVRAHHGSVRILSRTNI